MQICLSIPPWISWFCIVQWTLQEGPELLCMFNSVLTTVSCLISRGRTPSLQEHSLSLRLVIIILSAVLQTKALCCLTLTSNESDCSPAEVKALLSSTRAAVTKVKVEISVLVLWEGGNGSLRNQAHLCRWGRCLSFCICWKLPGRFAFYLVMHSVLFWPELPWVCISLISGTCRWGGGDLAVFLVGMSVVAVGQTSGRLAERLSKELRTS